MLDLNELLKKLDNDPLYKVALELASSDEEREKIKSVTRAVLTQWLSTASSVVKPSSAATIDDLKRSLGDNATLVRESDGKRVVDDD